MDSSNPLEIYNKMSDTVSKYFENADSTIPVQKTDKIVEDVIDKYRQVVN